MIAFTAAAIARQAQGVTRHQPGEGEHDTLHAEPWRGVAAHLHLAVVEVGRARLVLGILAGFAQCPVEVGDLAGLLPRVNRLPAASSLLTCPRTVSAGRGAHRQVSGVG